MNSDVQSKSSSHRHSSRVASAVGATTSMIVTVALAVAVLPVLRNAIQGVAGGLAVELEQCTVQRPTLPAGGDRRRACGSPTILAAREHPRSLHEHSSS